MSSKYKMAKATTPTLLVIILSVILQATLVLCKFQGQGCFDITVEPANGYSFSGTTSNITLTFSKDVLYQNSLSNHQGISQY
jgi:hypothetical protein